MASLELTTPTSTITTTTSSSNDDDLISFSVSSSQQHPPPLPPTTNELHHLQYTGIVLGLYPFYPLYRHTCHHHHPAIKAIVWCASTLYQCIATILVLFGVIHIMVARTPSSSTQLQVALVLNSVTLLALAIGHALVYHHYLQRDLIARELALITRAKTLDNATHSLRWLWREGVAMTIVTFMFSIARVIRAGSVEEFLPTEFDARMIDFLDSSTGYLIINIISSFLLITWAALGYHLSYAWIHVSIIRGRSCPDDQRDDLRKHQQPILRELQLPLILAFVGLSCVIAMLLVDLIFTNATNTSIELDNFIVPASFMAVTGLEFAGIYKLSLFRFHENAASERKTQRERSRSVGLKVVIRRRFDMLYELYRTFISRTVLVSFALCGYTALLMYTTIPKCMNLTKLLADSTVYDVSGCSERERQVRAIFEGLYSALAQCIPSMVLYGGVNAAGRHRVLSLRYILFSTCVVNFVIYYLCYLYQQETIAFFCWCVLVLVHSFIVSWHVAGLTPDTRIQFTVKTIQIVMAAILIYAFQQYILIRYYTNADATDRLRIVLFYFPVSSEIIRVLYTELCSHLYQFDSLLDDPSFALVFPFAFMSFVGRFFMLNLSSLQEQILSTFLLMCVEITIRSTVATRAAARVHLQACLTTGTTALLEQQKHDEVRRILSSDFAGANIYVKMFSETTSLLFAPLFTIIAVSYYGFKISVDRLLVSMVVQLVFEVIADILSSLVEQNYLKRRVFEVWMAIQSSVVHQLLRLAGVMVICGSVGHLSVKIVLSKYF